MTEQTADAEKIIEAVEEMVGGSWRLSAQQSFDSIRPLRNGTADDVIAAMPNQIEALRQRAAASIPGWEAHEVEPITIARALIISAPTTRGQVGSNKDLIFDQLDRKDIFQEGFEDGYAQCEEDMVKSLYQDALMRPAEKAGLQHHLRELRDDDRSFFAKAIDFYYSKERQDRLKREGGF